MLFKLKEKRTIKPMGRKNVEPDSCCQIPKKILGPALWTLLESKLTSSYNLKKILKINNLPSSLIEKLWLLKINALKISLVNLLSVIPKLWKYNWKSSWLIKPFELVSTIRNKRVNASWVAFFTIGSSSSPRRAFNLRKKKHHKLIGFNCF